MVHGTVGFAVVAVGGLGRAVTKDGGGGVRASPAHDDGCARTPVPAQRDSSFIRSAEFEKGPESATHGGRGCSMILRPRAREHADMLRAARGNDAATIGAA